MSHIRPEDQTPRRRRLACRRGRHDYGQPQHIGAGITRQVCEICAAVSIDLTGAYEAQPSIIGDNREIISLVTRDSDDL